MRLTNSYTILSRREAQSDNVSPDDFVLDLLSSAPAAHLPDRTLPYCVDMQRERVLFTTHDPGGFARVREAAFMFAEQLATAQSVHSVPFEHLSDAAAPSGPPPLLIFSPGRTGSTLLVRVLSAAGLPCASEPDILTQIAQLPKAAFQLLPPATREDLAQACIAALQRAMGGGLCIKLRSQSNERPLMLTQNLPGCRVVFMLRGVRAWAMSRHRSFKEDPEMVAGVLRQAIDSLDKLRFAGVDFAVLWFETLAADPVEAMRICAPSATFNPATVRAALAQDSQANTTISREAVAAASAQHGFLSAFEEAWTIARAGAQWQPWTEDIVADMWGR